ncbi:cryptochrome/photolyase family protein [Fulvivirga sediminis]|uniref:Deoxyribodipyrimidine photo-lyase n=1 Tax=Fulvivirga sediminis TaxID=2803949 RepID=A0A937K0A2_9BACT|nr:deoxyribodipyrimidine photo-lyase [Fulvivirga sediminis]MBL3657459.1 deoxyribodipyrimidine photo-lyase [Fulvivirga sediminis]
MSKINIFWFRRDLRVDDNIGLYHAMEQDLPVLLLFIFDKNILNELPKNDARVTFIHRQLQALNEDLKSKGSSILTLYDSPENAWESLIKDHNIHSVYTNHDYEPYAKDRDTGIEKLLSDNDILFKTYKDQVILEKAEVVKDDGEPYVVFTPYSKKWKQKASKKHFESVPSALYFSNFFTHNSKLIPLNEMGFEESDLAIPSDQVSESILNNYEERRDYPGVNGTSRLGVHLRFGTISIRKVATKAKQHSETFLNELIWREFYQMILWHFPRVVEENFKTKYNAVKWSKSEENFKKWCEGKTGYPMVDAGMRELNATGYMHNRVRMVTASFLTKHLLIDWRWGEAYFAEKLLDYELASNNGGWQWAAGTGTDAQPYFRIFNPESQLKKFDPDLKYVKKWVPEYGTDKYPDPIVDHKEARERTLNEYKTALDS